MRLAAALRSHADGASTLHLEVMPPVTVAAVLDAVATAQPALGRRLRDETGTQRQHVNIFVGHDNARDLEGLDTVVPEGTEVTVLPAISGG